MKNKFKIFCTFLMVLIVGALLNINSPQPSADTSGIAVEGVSTEIIPGESTPLIYSSFTYRKGWLQYLGNKWCVDNTDKVSFNLCTVFRVNKSVNNIKVDQIKYTLNADSQYNGVTKDLKDNTEVNQLSFNEGNGATYVLTTSAENPNSLFDQKNACDNFYYNLGDSIKVDVTLEIEGQTINLSLTSCKTRSTNFTTKDGWVGGELSYITQSNKIESPIPTNLPKTDPNNYNSYNVFQKCYDVDPNIDNLFDIENSIYFEKDNKGVYSIVNNKPVTKNLITECDRKYGNDEEFKNLVLVVVPYEPENSNIKKWFTPNDDDYNKNYKVSKIDPYHYNDLKFHAESSSPLFNRSDGNGNFFDGIVDFETVGIEDFNNNPDKYINSDGSSKYSVIVFGTCDCNGGKDLSQGSADACLKYLNYNNGNNHHNIILGHDTAIMDVQHYEEKDGGIYENDFTHPYVFPKTDKPSEVVYGEKDGVRFARYEGLDNGYLCNSWRKGGNDHPYFCWLATKANLLDSVNNGLVAQTPMAIGKGCYYNGLVDINNTNLSSSYYEQTVDKNNLNKMLGSYQVNNIDLQNLQNTNFGYYSEIYEYENNFNYANLTYPNKMSYLPVSINGTGKVLHTYHVPPCHTVGQKFVTSDGNYAISYLKFSGYPITDGFSIDKRNNNCQYARKGNNTFTDNSYLVSDHNKKIWMFQTGHSSGLASTQERQLWANLLCKLCYTNNTTQKSTEVKLMDSNPPLIKKVSKSSVGNNLNFSLKDNYTLNSFVCNNRDVTKIDLNINTLTSCAFNAGIKGYSYFFSDSNFGVPNKDECNGDEDELARYQSGDFETYTFDSWKNFNSKSGIKADLLFSNSTVVKTVKKNADGKYVAPSSINPSINLNGNTNGYKYLYICLFDNSTRMRTTQSDLNSLGYDGLSDDDNSPVLQNGNSNLDETLHDEWNLNLNPNWDSIKKYGNRTVIRIKLADNKVTTHITNSHYVDDSTPDRFWTNESNRSDSKATTGNEVITTVTKFSKNADKNAQKIIAIGDSSTPSASLDNAKAWIDPESNSKEIVDTNLVKSIKVVGTESTGDYVKYTIEWTIADYANSPYNTNELYYNYAYIDSSDPVSNGCQENFTVDNQSPKITYKPYNSGTKYDIKVLDSDSNDGTLYQSGLNSIKVNLIDGEGDRTETSCKFSREGNKRVNEKTLTLETDLSAYSKIEIIAEDNVGNKSKSTIKIVKEPKDENSGEVNASLKNWYYSSNSKNKWVSGSSNPSMINTSNEAYISIDSPTYNLIHNEEYAGNMAAYKAVSQNLTPDGEPETDSTNGSSEVNLVFKNYGGVFSPSLLEQYNKLTGTTTLSNVLNNHNSYLSIDTSAKVKYDDSPSENLDKYTYYRTIPIKGIKDVVGRGLSMNIINKQDISATQPCYYYTYTQEKREITPAWDERNEETGELIPGGHHKAKEELVTVSHKHNTSVNYSSKESVESSTTLDETLSVDSTKPTITVKKTGRYTNEVSITDLDKDGLTKGASGIHTIKLGLSSYSNASLRNCCSAFDQPNEYMIGSGIDAYIDCWKGQTPKDHENNVSVGPVHELTFNLDCFKSTNVPNYLHERVDSSKYTIYKYLIFEIEDNVGNRITGCKDLNPTIIDTTITEDGRPPKDYPEDNTPDRPNPLPPANPNGPDGKLYDKNVSINANPTEITDPKDNSKKRKIVDVEVNASITNPTPGFSPKLEIWGYGKNDEYRRPSDFSNLINKSNKDEMAKFGERPLTKDTYAEIYVDDTYNTPNKPTAHVDISSTASLLKFKELEDPKLPYFFEVYTKTCNAEDWIKEVDTLHPLYFASGYDHDRIVIYKVDGDHREPNEYWKNNPVLSGKYYGTGSGEGSVDISNLRTGWYKAELIMYDFNGNPSGKEEIWFYQNQPALYTPFNVSISAVKDVDWEGDVRFNYKETRVLPSGINSDVKDNNSNSYVNKDIEINQDSNRRPGSFVSDTGDSDYYPLGLNFGANGDSLKRIDWTNSDKTSYNKPKEGDTDKGNPIAKGYAVNWNFSKENKQQLNSLSLNYSYTTTSGDSLTIYSSDGSTKLTDDPSNGLYVNKQELTQTQLDALNSSVDNSNSLNGYLKPPSYDPSKSMFTKIPVKHYLPENFVAKTSSGSVYNGVVIVTVTFKCSVKEGTMSTNAVDQSMDLYAIYQGETALDDVTIDRQR